MGKTTNILDLNNRLSKVEKENVAQNNYNSLKNRPKINGNLLTGDKTGSQLGLANTQDIDDLIYHKIAESESTGTLGSKLQSLTTAYNSLSLAQRRSALLVVNSVTIYQPIDCSGNWFGIWVESSGAYLTRYGIAGSAYVETGGTVTDNSSVENTDVFELWVCEPN